LTAKEHYANLRREVREAGGIMPEYFGRVGILKARNGLTRQQMKNYGHLGSTHVPIGTDGLLASSFFGFEKGGRVYGISVTIWASDQQRRDGHQKLKGDWNKPPIVNDVELVDFETFELEEPAQDPATVSDDDDDDDDDDEDEAGK
jgi:hypothetical protein